MYRKVLIRSVLKNVNPKFKKIEVKYFHHNNLRYKTCNAVYTLYNIIVDNDNTDGIIASYVNIYDDPYGDTHDDYLVSHR